MGNQMFQYALGLKLATELQTDLKLDLSSLLDRSKGDFVYRNYDLPIFKVSDKLLLSERFLKTIYQAKISRITRIVRRYIESGKGFIKEKDFHFDSTLISNPTDDTVYEGWFQSPKYFAGIENEIRKEFQFQDAILEHSQSLFEKIKNIVWEKKENALFIFDVDDEATYEHYFFLRHEHIRAMQEVRNQEALISFGKKYEFLDRANQKKIRFKIPMIVDEFYKASSKFDKERSPSLIRAMIKLGAKSNQKYYLAPNITSLDSNPFTEDMEFIRLDFNTVFLEKHELYNQINNNEEKSEKILEILNANNGKSLIYAGTYSNIDSLTNLFLDRYKPIKNKFLQRLKPMIKKVLSLKKILIFY